MTRAAEALPTIRIGCGIGQADPEDGSYGEPRVQAGCPAHMLIHNHQRLFRHLPHLGP